MVPILIIPGPNEIWEIGMMKKNTNSSILRLGLSILLVSLMLLILLVPTSHDVAAFGELTNVNSSLSPSSARPSSSAHISITLYNNNNRSLEITTVDLQIYESMFFSDISTHYHVFTGAQVIPSGGSGEFGLDAKLPNYLGTCSVTIAISGTLEGDSDSSVGLTTSSIFLDPTIPISFSDLLPFIVVGAILVIAVLAAVFYLIFRKQ